MVNSLFKRSLVRFFFIASMIVGNAFADEIRYGDEVTLKNVATGKYLGCAGQSVALQDEPFGWIVLRADLDNYKAFNGNPVYYRNMIALQYGDRFLTVNGQNNSLVLQGTTVAWLPNNRPGSEQSWETCPPDGDSANLQQGGGVMRTGYSTVRLRSQYLTFYDSTLKKLIRRFLRNNGTSLDVGTIDEAGDQSMQQWVMEKK